MYNTPPYIFYQCDHESPNLLKLYKKRYVKLWTADQVGVAGRWRPLYHGLYKRLNVYTSLQDGCREIWGLFYKICMISVINEYYTTWQTHVMLSLTPDPSLHSSSHFVILSPIFRVANVDQSFEQNIDKFNKFEKFLLNRCHISCLVYIRVGVHHSAFCTFLLVPVNVLVRFAILGHGNLYMAAAGQTSHLTKL